MNIKELKQKMAEIIEKAKAAEDIEEQKSLMADYDQLKEQLDLAMKMEDAEKAFVAAQPVMPEQKSEESDSYEKAVKSFADAARAGFKKSLNEGTPKDGGYTVPVEISTKIENYRDAEFSLRELVDVKTVSTMSGERTFMKRSTINGFGSVSEGGKIQAIAQPEFERKPWKVEKYGGYMPVTNELLDDSDANIAAEVIAWFGDMARVTDNKIILATMDEKYTRSSSPETAKAIASIDDIKKVVNVDLGQAFKNSTVIVTNDSGLNWLDTLRDNDGRYLLAPDPANTMQLRLAVGGIFVPVKVVPSTDLPNESSGKYPFYIGDLKEAIKLFDRKQLSIMSSNTAAIGTLNAFEEDLTIWRGIERLDCVCFDDQAYFKGFVTPAAG